MTSTTLRPGPARTTQEGTAENAETERLFQEHSARLLAYCSRQLGSRSEAEDAVQTTFLYALRALRSGVVPECEIAWLTKIAKNVCNWQRRTHDRRGPLASDIDLDMFGAARPEGDEDGVLVGLKDALASIPENQRTALVLREWRGVPAREIAAQLGMTAPAIHALLTRARRSLAEALTVARRPVLGLAWFAVELRSHVKALLGGASAKAAAVTVAAVAVVGTGVGGVAIQRSPGEAKAPFPPLEAVSTATVGPKATAPAPAPRASRASAPAPREKSGTVRTSATENVRPTIESPLPSTLSTVPMIGPDQPQ
ncbi:MAG: sigma-70 family RNA polymerase sigma factor, partial [Actinobacteria bacterium]|nr:sigma-70 family RNA polymerase sigma factor [Actinomycetota bacterium]